MTFHPEAVLVPAFMVSVRIAALMTFAPFLGSLAVPARVKAGLTAMLTLLLYPLYAPAAVSLESVNWVQFAISEVTVGLLLGLTLHFVFDGLRLAGEAVGFQVGFSIATLFDPQSNANAPVLSVLHQIITILIFLQLDIHHWLLRGLAKSFEYIPLGTASPTDAMIEALLQIVGGLWLVAVQIAAPIIAVTMLADVAMGFMGKAAPQLPVLFVGLSVKVVLALLVWSGTVMLWPNLLEGYFMRAVGYSEWLLGLTR